MLALWHISFRFEKNSSNCHMKRLTVFANKDTRNLRSDLYEPSRISFWNSNVCIDSNLKGKKRLAHGQKQKTKTKHYMEDFKNNFHRAILREGWVLPLPKQCRIINWWKPLYYFQILLQYAYRISLFTSCRFFLLLFLFFTRHCCSFDTVLLT